MKEMNKTMRAARGISLLEVVLGVAVFAIGMLALIELQTGIARSGSDANTRTVAANIAEEIVEQSLGFTQLAADGGNGRIDYTEILSYDSAATVERGGFAYSVNLAVEDHYWDNDSESFTTTQPDGIVYSDFKTVDIVVMWRPLANGESFDDHDTIDLGEGGGIRLVEAIPSTPGLLAASVIANKEALGGVPPVEYSPGDNPDIVALTLDADGGKFKESTSPVPDVIRGDKVETWFDVVTYSQISDQATFLRREEFLAINCSCTLETAPAEAEYGYKPTLWNGLTYTEGEQVAKPIGVAPGNVQQSAFCSLCCRDHHDGGGSSAEDVYQLSNAGSSDDHAHYGQDAEGNILSTPVGDGEDYVEACRLVRKDGFMRVTQDAAQRALVGFPEGYLEFDEGVDEYSAYVVEAVSSYYAGDQGNFPQPNPPDTASTHEFPARTPATATALPTLWAQSQQLRSRGVYTDYLTSAAQAVVDACFPVESRTDDCRASYATTELELYPFFELQTTLLARWNTNPLSDTVSVSNEPIQNNNVHSRGLAELIGDDTGQATVRITSHNGNLGLTASGPVTPLYEYELNLENLYINANGGDTPLPPIGSVVSGSLTSTVRRVPPGDLLLTAENAICGQTDTRWYCVLTGPGFLTVSNYYLNNPRVYVCSDLGLVGETVGTSKSTSTTTFALPSSGEDLDIWVTSQYEDCGR